MNLKKYFIGLSFTSLTLLTSLTFVFPVHAAYVDTPACRAEMYNQIAHEKRIFRSVLFGQKKSKDSPIGSVRYDKQGTSWLKNDTNTWNAIGADAKVRNRSDGVMDDEADIEERHGLFEVKKVSTSDQLPAVLQSFRAYQCRLRAVCMAVSASQNAEDDTPTVDVQPDGCISFMEPVLKNCKYTESTTISTSSCDDAVEAVLTQETQTLTLLVAYDSAYRSLLQFQGVFEGFLSDFRFSLLQPLWQTVRVMGNLSRLPCFLSQCDE